MDCYEWKKGAFIGDNWIKNIGQLQCHARRNLSMHEMSLTFKNYIMLDMSWNWKALQYIVPTTMLICIASTPSPHEKCGDDILAWDALETGRLTTKLAYIRIVNTIYSVNAIWKVLYMDMGRTYYNLVVPLTFWLEYMLLRSKYKVRCGLTTVDICNKCAQIESIIHILDGKVWEQLGKNDNIIRDVLFRWCA